MKKRLINLLSDEKLPLESGVDPEVAAEQLLIYLAEWRRWNAKINLTAETDEYSVIDRHIRDSLQYTRAVSPGARVVDIGSGAGFPGIPLKVALPSLEMVLVENQRKRANFLKNVIRSMQLQGLRSIHSRVEDLGDSFQNKFDFIVLRHVKDFKASLKMGRALLCPEGRVVIQKEAGAPSPELDFLHFHSETPLTRPGRSPSKLMVFQRVST